VLENQSVRRLEIPLVSLAALSALPGTLIALATTRLVLTTLTTLALARLPLPSALNATTLAGRFSAMWLATLSTLLTLATLLTYATLLTLTTLLTLATLFTLLTLSACCGRSTLGLFLTLTLLLVGIS
jgi:hypothetical protein